jgi:hypothetical protein
MIIHLDGLLIWISTCTKSLGATPMSSKEETMPTGIMDEPVTIKALKKMAKTLKKSLEPEVKITHSKALESVSRTMGYSSWHAAVEHFKPKPLPPKESKVIEGPWADPNIDPDGVLDGDVEAYKIVIVDNAEHNATPGTVKKPRYTLAIDEDATPVPKPVFEAPETYHLNMTENAKEARMHELMQAARSSDLMVRHNGKTVDCFRSLLSPLAIKVFVLIGGLHSRDGEPGPIDNISRHFPFDKHLNTDEMCRSSLFRKSSEDRYLIGSRRAERIFHLNGTTVPILLHQGIEHAAQHVGGDVLVLSDFLSSYADCEDGSLYFVPSRTIKAVQTTIQFAKSHPDLKDDFYLWRHTW